MMKNFTFSVPQDIISGAGSLARLPEAVKKLGGTHAFLISGPVLRRMGLISRCADMLATSGIESSEFTETEGNPSVETVEKAKEAFLTSKADILVAIGGGSPMDVAKAVGIVARYGRSITDYEGGGKVPGEIVPLVAVPTTAGTGSEVTAFSVITDHSRNYKLTVSDSRLIPACAILDAELIMTAPCFTAASCGMDAFTHALEAYLSKASSPFTDAMAEKAMELIGHSIRRYVADRTDSRAADEMLTGSMFAGLSFSWARLGNVHAMSHPVSAYFNVPHGMANAILLPTVVEYNALADSGRYFRIYQYIAIKPVSREEFEPGMLAEAIRRLNRSLGIPASLSEVGVTGDTFEAMAEDAMKSGNIAVNPRASAKQDILELYRKAF